MTHPVPQHELARVVTAAPDRGPGVQRRELVGPEQASGTIGSNRRPARELTNHIQVKRVGDVVPVLEHEEIVVNVLRGTHTTSSYIGEYILPKGYSRNGSGSRIKCRVQDMRRRVVVHARRRISKIRGRSQIHLLQEMTAKSPKVSRLEGNYARLL